MPALAKFGAGQICRPLLANTREEIERYAHRHRLRWVDDPTNMETQFARNFLRAKVLPVIRQQWHGVDAAIARSANHMAEAARLLGNLGRADFERVADGNGANVAALRALPPARRRNALRTWIASLAMEPPSTAKMTEISGSLLAARADAQPEVAWRGGVMRRRGGRLVLEVKSEDQPTPAKDLGAKSWDWNADRVCVLSRSGDRLELLDDDAGPIDLDLLPARLDIRARGGGETLKPGPRARTQALKKLIQAAKMSVEERAHLPLLFFGDRLVAAGDRWIDASVAANDKSRRRARLSWTRAR
jgi:tRNA(Ile)-lysidine synthase